MEIRLNVNNYSIRSQTHGGKPILKQTLFLFAFYARL